MLDWKLTKSYCYEGHSIKYDVVGDGPPIVLVHGTPWSSFNLRHLIRTLSETHSVYFYDMLGYGQSDMPDEDISLARQNLVLDKLLKHWALENPLIVGHDFGGATVLRTCLLNSHNFERMFLIDPVAVSPWGSPFFKHVREHQQAFAGVPDYIHKAIVRAYIETASFEEIDSDTFATILRPWTSSVGKAAFYRQIAQADSQHTDEVQSMYGDIKRPVHILWGREDVWIPLAQGELLHKFIPTSTFDVITDAGHLVIEEQPTKVAELIQQRLNSLKHKRTC